MVVATVEYRALSWLVLILSWQLIPKADAAVEVDERCYETSSGHLVDFWHSDHPALISRWLTAGGLPGATGYRLEEVVELAYAEVTFHDSMSSSCAALVLSVVLTACLFENRTGDSCHVPWELVMAPWEYLARSSWPIFDLVALWAKRLPRESKIFDAKLSKWDCDENSRRILESIPVSLLDAEPEMIQPTARLIASILVKDPTFSQVPFLGDICGRLVWNAVLTVLSLAHDDPLVSPGYALRTNQMFFTDVSRKYPEHFVQILTQAPFRVLEHVPLLVSQDLLREPELNLKEVSHISQNSHNSSDFLTRDVLGPFTPMPQAQAQALEETLAVTHEFLMKLGAAYMLIAGSLLGAIRHMGRIPWDDDVDLCVDAAHEMQLVMLAVYLEAERLQLPLPSGYSVPNRRALAILHAKKRLLQVMASRALVFRIKGEAEVHVDIWLCYYLASAQQSSNDVILMSRMFGPRIPRQFIEPLKKLPFDSLALWVPSDPEMVTHLYFEQQNVTTDFMNTCMGRKVHAAKLQINAAVPCRSVADLATPWERTLEGKDLVFSALEAVLHRMPGVSHNARILELWHSLVGGEPRYFVLWEGINAELGDVNCTALLWRKDLTDLQHPGMMTELPLRSLICGHSGVQPHFVWEDAW